MKSRKRKMGRTMEGKMRVNSFIYVGVDYGEEEYGIDGNDYGSEELSDGEEEDREEDDDEEEEGSKSESTGLLGKRKETEVPEEEVGEPEAKRLKEQ